MSSWLATLGVLRPPTATVRSVGGGAMGYPSIASAIAAAAPGDTVRIAAGTYIERLVIDRPLTLIGRGNPIIDGGARGSVIEVRADDVSIEGLVVQNTGFAYTDDYAGIHLDRVRRCRIINNRIANTQLGVHADSTSRCIVRGNTLVGKTGSQSIGGNGIHAWSADSLVVAGNTVRGHRDGIYFEFVRYAEVSDNRISESERYGLHFMYSSDCRYLRNRFRGNTNGIAVMYSQRVQIVSNRFEGAQGGSAYGLLLKEISDSEIERNVFDGNSSALMLDAANRNVFRRNRIIRNGWGVRLLASSTDNRFEHNEFAGNAFDVSTNSPRPQATFSGNIWDRYTGYDLDHDGFGDVPHRPVTLFASVVERVPATVILLRSLLVDVLSVAERALPLLTPDLLYDDAPRMRVGRSSLAGDALAGTTPQ
ncbi:MAG: nitrous oxide reductase family maturation protein NosD [Gemmatimonadaceae bacterium]|nr:nitrous oxide reductase family maturation protein NosD [Gemmatimonadaceae bacterium]